jgi:hypothetical protein
LVGWEEPKYNGFYQRLGKCHTTKYTTLRHTSNPKKRKANSIIFSMLYDEMQEKLENTWKITPRVVRVLSTFLVIKMIL